MNTIEKLQNILKHVKSTFVGKDQIVDLLGICLVARENAFLLGPPGTAKSALVRELSSCISGGQNFEYLLTRFTEPNEIFGPFDIRKLKEGELVTNTDGMMPEAALVFLDEIFNANSAILNSLLMALNEKIFRRGKEVIKLPALMFVGASNQLPDDEALNALLDRFLIRVRCGYVDTDLLGQVLLAGRSLERPDRNSKPEISAKEIQELQATCKTIDLSSIQNEYVNIIHMLRNAGIQVSDRRAVKVQNLIAASALLSGRDSAVLSDLWVIKHIWDEEDQIEILSGIVEKNLQETTLENAHPQAANPSTPDPEHLANEVVRLTEEWNSEDVPLSDKNRIKDKLRHIQSQSNWVADALKQSKLQESIDALWNQILQST